jgi:hypothetical protein
MLQGLGPIEIEFVGALGNPYNRSTRVDDPKGLLRAQDLMEKALMNGKVNIVECSG